MKTFELEDKDERVDLTPMIDIIFLLIIFFMVVGAILTQEKVEMDMAVADEASVPKENSGRLLLNVDKDGLLYVGNRLIDYSEIPGYIALTGGDPVRPDFKVYLRADRRTPYRFIRDVLKGCAGAGAADVIFGVTQTDVSSGGAP